MRPPPTQSPGLRHSGVALFGRQGLGEPAVGVFPGVGVERSAIACCPALHAGRVDRVDVRHERRPVDVGQVVGHLGLHLRSGTVAPRPVRLATIDVRPGRAVPPLSERVTVAAAAGARSSNSGSNSSSNLAPPPARARPLRRPRPGDSQPTGSGAKSRSSSSSISSTASCTGR